MGKTGTKFDLSRGQYEAGVDKTSRHVLSSSGQGAADRPRTTLWMYKGYSLVPGRREMAKKRRLYLYTCSKLTKHEKGKEKKSYLMSENKISFKQPFHSHADWLAALHRTGKWSQISFWSSRFNENKMYSIAVRSYSSYLFGRTSDQQICQRYQRSCLRHSKTDTSTATYHWAGQHWRGSDYE